MSTAVRGRRLSGAALSLPASLLVLIIVLIPTLQLFRYSLNIYDPIESMRSALTLENYAKFFVDAYYLNVLRTTLQVAALCTALSLVLGFPIAYMLAKTQTRWKSLLIVLLVFPLMVGSVVRSAGWMVVLGNVGFINSTLITLGIIDQPIRLLYTSTAVVLGTTGVVLPYMILTLQSVLEGVDLTVEEAARNLGAGFFRTLWRVVLPIAIPGVAAGTMLVFILCMNAYATPVLLGGTGIAMMAPAVYDQVSKAANWPFGATLALILMLVTLVCAVASNVLIHRRYSRNMAS
jgi:putative spermidine/putrescine transport system permease protein